MLRPQTTNEEQLERLLLRGLLDKREFQGVYGLHIVTPVYVRDCSEIHKKNPPQSTTGISKINSFLK
jgi:hypothetical protein